MKFYEAVTSLKHKKDKNFILTGSEPFLKEYFIRIATKVNDSYECMEILPDNQQEALDLICSDNLFSSNYLIILRDFDKMNISDFEEGIKSFEGTILFLLTEKADLKSRSMTKIVGHATIVECTKLKEYGVEYPNWITSYISDSGYKAQNGVDNSVFFKVGPNMFAIAKELEKIFLVKTDKIVTLSDVDKFVSKTSISTTFDLLDHLLRKDVKSALVCFDSLASTQDHFIDLTGFLGLYLEKMYRLLLLHESKMDPKDLADIVGLPFFLVRKKYLPRVTALGKRFIASKIDGLCQVDAQLRLFKGEKRIIFEKFILSFSE